MSRRALSRAAAGAVALACLVLSGCTIGPAGDEETAAADGSAPAPGTGTPTAGEDGRGEGPSPAELSRQVLDAGAGVAAAEPLGSDTGPLRTAGAELTIDVVGVDRVTDGVLVELRLSTTGETATLQGQEFRTERFGARNFLRDVFLEDAEVTDTRYRPLQFEDYRSACVCPYLPIEVGPEPQSVYALFPPLPPEVGTVDLRLAGSDIAVEALPVSG